MVTIKVMINKYTNSCEDSLTKTELQIRIKPIGDFPYTCMLFH